MRYDNAMDEKTKERLLTFADLTLRYCAGYLVLSAVGESRSARESSGPPVRVRVSVAGPEGDAQSSAALPSGQLDERDGPEVVDAIVEEGPGRSPRRPTKSRKR